MITSSALAQMISSPAWDSRILEESEPGQWSNDMTVYATANRATFSDEIAKRTCPVMLSSASLVKRVEDFRHTLSHGLPLPDGMRARTWGEVMAAIRYWQGQGSPAPSAGYEVPRFGAWYRAVGGVLESIRVPGTWMHWEAWREATAGGDSNAALDDLLEAWACGRLKDSVGSVLPTDTDAWVPTKDLHGAASRAGLLPDDRAASPYSFWFVQHYLGGKCERAHLRLADGRVVRVTIGERKSHGKVSRCRLEATAP